MEQSNTNSIAKTETKNVDSVQKNLKENTITAVIIGAIYPIINSLIQDQVVRTSVSSIVVFLLLIISPFVKLGYNFLLGKLKHKLPFQYL